MLGLLNLSGAEAQKTAGAICSEVSEDGSLTWKSEANRLAALCDCSDLASLTIKNKSVIALPPCFGQMVNLRELDLKKTKLARFPVEILEMESLEHLSLAFTDITFLPENLWKLTALKKLDLRGTGITSLPQGLEHLEMIDFRLCELTQADQQFIRAQYPDIPVYFSSPCNCY